ncbi:uncharacterized protein [Littorina saxatilis]
MRPSMGHKMQVELRENMHNYQNNRLSLQTQLSELRFDKQDLYTSPVPPSPTPSIKNWSDAGSRFSSAPDKAAHKARLAKLEQENTTLSLEAKERELNARNTLLPPLPSKGDHNTKAEAEDSSPAKDSSHTQATEEEKCAEEAEKKNLRFGANTELKTPQSQQPRKKGGKGKKNGGRTAGATLTKSALKDRPQYVLKLPTIHAVPDKRTQWDSGRNHIHRKGKSISLEKSSIEEECRNFSHCSINIPSIVDPKRMEIRLPPVAKPPVSLPKVKFTGRQLQKATPAPVAVVYTQSTPLEARTSNTRVQDHFPQGRSRLPELDDTLSDVTDSEGEGEGGLEVSGRLHLPSLPVVRLSESKMMRHNFENTTHLVPRLALDNSKSSSMLSLLTGRSGATGATYMSQETLEWKGQYMTSANPDRKNRMLTEILHAVRARMRDNAEDIKMASDDPRPGDTSSMREGSDILFLPSDRVTPSSGATTATTRALNQKLLNPARYKQKVAATASRKQAPKLHNYLQKLSHRRKVVDQRQLERVRFQLAYNTIREMTQESLGHHSNVKTATGLAA